MASLQPQPAGGRQPHRHPASLRIDMTPMVDLGFLLITFFVITASLSSQAVMPLVVPKDGPPTNAGATSTLTVLLGRNDRIAVYSGFWEEAVAANNIATASYHVASGIGAVIRRKQQQLVAAGKLKDDLLIVVKPGTDASYKNVVDMLDEITINGVQRYALVPPTAAEEQFMALPLANKP